MRNATGCNLGISALFQVVAFCAVNSYGIISGYVGYREEEKKYHYAKYLRFWFPVFFYNIGITIYFYMTTSNVVNIKNIIMSAFPVTSYSYWYVNAYTALFFLIPWINRLLHNVNKKELNQLILILFMVFSVYQTFSNKVTDTFKLGGGYDFAWLVFMYIVGAWIKKNKINEKVTRFMCVVLILICISITWMWERYAPIANNIFLSYMSITIVLIAVGVVIIFSKLQLKSPVISVVRFFSPAAFGVYLIHEQTLVREFLIHNTFSWLGTCKIFMIPFLIIGCAGLIFVVCLFSEKLRLILFEFLKINRLISISEEKLDLVLNKCFNKICR